MNIRFEKTSSRLIAIGFILATATSTANAGFSWALPDPQTTAVLYGDFYSYSFPVLDLADGLAGGDGTGTSWASSGSTYTDTSGTTTPFAFNDTLGGPSALDPVLMIYGDTQGERENGDLTGYSQYSNLQNNGFEDAYESNQPTEPWFTTASSSNSDVLTTNDPLHFDRPQTWDANYEDFVGYLTDNDGNLHQAVFNFQNNDTGNADNLSVWFQVVLWNSADVDMDGNFLQGTTQTVLELSNNCPVGNLCVSGGYYTGTGSGALTNPAGTDRPAEGGIVSGPGKDPSIFTATLATGVYPEDGMVSGTPTAADFVTSGADLCFSPTGALLDTTQCTGGNDPDKPLEHNLGANEIAYGATSPELDALLLGYFLDPTSSAYNMVSVDFRVGCNSDPDGTPMSGDEIDCDSGNSFLNFTQDNGPDRFWVARGNVLEGPDDPNNPMPVPGTLLLMGIGLYLTRYVGFRG